MVGLQKEATTRTRKLKQGEQALPDGSSENSEATRAKTGTVKPLENSEATRAKTGIVSIWSTARAYPEHKRAESLSQGVAGQGRGHKCVIILTRPRL